jgi:hypothetical protein
MVDWEDVSQIVIVGTNTNMRVVVPYGWSWLSSLIQLSFFLFYSAW